MQFSWEIGAGTLVPLRLPPWEKVCQREARGCGSVYEFWETDRAWEQREGARRVQITSSNPQQSRSWKHSLPGSSEAAPGGARSGARSQQGDTRARESLLSVRSARDGRSQGIIRACCVSAEHAAPAWGMLSQHRTCGVTVGHAASAWSILRQCTACYVSVGADAHQCFVHIRGENCDRRVLQ